MDKSVLSVKNNYMVQTPSWEANSSLTIQEITRTLRNPTVHYCIQKHPPPVPILIQINAFHASPTHFLKTGFNIIFPYMPRSSKWSLSFVSHQQNSICTSRVSHAYHMPRPPHSRFDHPNISWGVKIIKFLVMQSSPLPCYLDPIRPKYSPQHPILEDPHSKFFLQCDRPSFTPIQNNRQSCSSAYLNLYIFG